MRKLKNFLKRKLKKNSIKNDYNHLEENGFETAKKIMTINVPFAPITFNIGQVEKMLHDHSKEYEMIDYIYVIDKKQILCGVISIKEVFRYPKKTLVKDVMKKEIFSVRGSTDQEKATLLALEHNLKAIPVLDKENKFLGVLTNKVIIDTLHKEGIEDALRSVGISKFKDPTLQIINASASVHFMKRIPWLLIGLFGGFLAALVVGMFEKILEAYVLLAAFIPAVVYMADAVGTQSQTLFIRSMALDKKMKFWKYFLREFKVNIVLGLVLGLGFYSMLLLGWGLENSFFAIILGISIFLTVLISMGVAILLPIIFQKLKSDPAVSSGPLATAIRDLTSLLVYFGVAHVLINNFM